jgi:DNA-binding NarL/FixJ family response regulator
MAPKDQIKIILADDHAMVRQGIKKILQEKPGLTVIAEALDGRDLLEKLESVTPDLAIVDISMPRMGGLEAALHIKKRYPHVKILILTMHRDKEFLKRAREIGVDGYILKEEMDVDLHSAIDHVLLGKSYTSPLLR